MTITDELRNWAKVHTDCSMQLVSLPPKHLLTNALLEDVLSIADRIDEEHKREVVKGLNEYQHGRDEGWSEAMGLMEREYVQLPHDADGVPIRIGDKVTEHEDGHTFKVDGFMDWGGEWWVFMRDGIQAPVSKCTHYREPTTEDVLTELEGMRGGYATYEDVVTRCAELAATLRKLLAKED